jgi:hypothetical protein
MADAVLFEIEERNETMNKDVRENNFSDDCLHFKECIYAGKHQCVVSCGYYSPPLFEEWKKSSPESQQETIPTVKYEWIKCRNLSPLSEEDVEELYLKLKHSVGERISWDIRKMDETNLSLHTNSTEKEKELE